MPRMTTPIIFDRRAVRLHRDRAASLIDPVLPVLEDLAERLLDRLDDARQPFFHALDLGGRGVVAPLLRARGIHVTGADLSAPMAARTAAPVVVLDEERLPFAPASFDLVVANMSLHWVNDLPGTLIQLRMALRPGGLMLASFPVLGTLGALRTALTQTETALSDGASPRVSPFPELRDLAGLMQRAGFDLPVADLDDVSLAYMEPMRLLLELRQAGETNATMARTRRPAPRLLLPSAVHAMPQSNGTTPVSLKVGTVTGFAPGQAVSDEP